MAKRKSLSKSKRFEIFKRDNYRCKYCGSTPLTTALRVDHIVPVKEGGTDDDQNLVTACHDCNAGKGATPLEKKKFSPLELTEEIEDRGELIRLYMEAQKRRTEALAEAAAPLQSYWEERIGPLSQDMADRLVKLISEWPVEKLHEAIQITARKLGTPGEEFRGYNALKQQKYFSGVLRRWREEAASPAAPDAREELERSRLEARVAISALNEINREAWSVGWAADEWFSQRYNTARFRLWLTKKISETRGELGGAEPGEVERCKKALDDFDMGFTHGAIFADDLFSDGGGI